MNRKQENEKLRKRLDTEFKKRDEGSMFGAEIEHSVFVMRQIRDVLLDISTSLAILADR